METLPTDSKLLRVVNTHLATMAATGGVLLTLTMVPQTAAILAKAGLAEYAYDPAGTATRTAAFVAMAVGYVLLFLGVVPPDPAVGGPPIAPPVARAQAAVLARTEFVSVAVLRALSRLSRGGRVAIGLSVVALGYALEMAVGSASLAPRFGVADLASAWPELVITGFGAWIALVPDRVVKDPATFHWAWRVPARMLAAVGVLAVIGQLLWALPTWTNGEWSTLGYTVWGVGFLVFLAAILGRLVDAAAARTAWPVRFGALAGVMLLLGGDSADVLQPNGERATGTDATPDAWYDAVLSRLDRMGPQGPVVLVAASGGGSRAALFASLTYQALEDAHLGGDPANPTLASRILLISSVSGGSLASAYYQHAVLDGKPLPTRDQLRNVRVDALGNAMRAESGALVKRAMAKFGEAKDPAMRDLVVHFQAVDQQVGAWPGRAIAEAPWLATSAFLDDMGSDFMAAVLRAVVEPDLSRGAAITRLWISRFGLGELDNAPGQTPAAPLVLYNSTDVETGSRFVVGLPRLPSGLFGHSVGAMDDPEGKTWVSAAQAARLSANFPWGFDVVRLPLQGSVELLDGGIVDNTGVDTFATLFERLALAERPSPPYSASQAEKARRILTILRERGVVLVEIDAGARPSEGAGAGSLLAGFTRPLRALDAAGANSAFAARDENIDRVRSVVNGGADDGRFVHVTWVCNRIDNVQTAWSLGTRDEAVTTLQFLAEQHRLAPALRDLQQGFGADHAAFQARVDAEVMRTRELQIEVASDAPDHVRERAAVAVDDRSRVGAQRTAVAAARPPAGLRALPEDLSKDPERAAEAVERAKAALLDAIRVADLAGKGQAALGKAVDGVAGAGAGTQAALQHAASAVKDANELVNAVGTGKDVVKQAADTVKGASDAVKAAKQVQEQPAVKDLLNQVAPTDKKGKGDKKSK